MNLGGIKGGPPILLGPEPGLGGGLCYIPCCIVFDFYGIMGGKGKGGYRYGMLGNGNFCCCDILNNY